MILESVKKTLVRTASGGMNGMFDIPYIEAAAQMVCNFIELALRDVCSPLNLLHILKTPFWRTPLDGCFCL